MTTTDRVEGAGTVFRSRVGRRLLLLFVGCALMPLCAFGWLALSQVTAQLGEEIERTLHRSAKAAGMELADRLLSLTNELEIARDLCAGAGLAAASGPLLDHLLTEVKALALQDQAGIRNELGPEIAPVRLTADEQAHLGTDRWLAHVDGAADGPRVLLLRRVRNGDATSPVLVAELRPEQLVDVEALRGSGTEVLVLTAAMNVVAHSSAVPDLAPLHAAIKREPAAATLPWEVHGEEHLARYWRVFLRPQLGLDWFVVQSTPRTRATSALQAFQNTFALTAALALLLVIAASLVQIRALLQPIRRLVRTTRAVRAGAFDARAGLRSHDEFGELGRSFDAMTEELVENIRRRELTEVDLIAARDAALEAVRVKAEFLTNVTHELRTPLTSIVSSAEILRQFGDDDPATRAEFLGIVCGETERLQRLIEGVLQLSGDDDDEALAPVTVAATVRAAVAELSPAARARVEFAAEVNDDAGRVQGEAARLQQLWSHLLDNAVKFSPPGSPIAVRLRRRSETVVVEVVDRGVGIPDSEQARIFEPFHQGQRDILTEKVAGIGLGLTLAHSIVEHHGGRIHVTSAPDQGATFRVVLPALPAAVPTTVPTTV